MGVSREFCKVLVPKPNPPVQISYWIGLGWAQEWLNQGAPGNFNVLPGLRTTDSLRTVEVQYYDLLSNVFCLLHF